MVFFKKSWARETVQRRKLTSSICTLILGLASFSGMLSTTGCTGLPSVLGDLVLTNITIKGESTVTQGSTSTYSAVATYDDGSTEDALTGLTWTVKEGPGSISDAGVYTAPESVETDTSVTIHVSLTENGITQEAEKTITVLKSTSGLGSIAISGPDTVTAGTEASFTLTATKVDGSTVDVTSSATWTVFDGPGEFSATGTFTAPASVTEETLTTIKASYTENGFTLEVEKAITLTPAPINTPAISSLTISGPDSINENETASFTATATYDDGSSKDVTPDTTWAASGEGSFTSPGAYAPGSVDATATVTLTASYTSNGITREVNKTVTVTNVETTKTLSSIAIAGPDTLNAGGTGSFTATATYSDNSTEDITAKATWSLSSTAANAGTMAANGSYTAPATVSTEIAVTITAEYNSVKATRTLTLTATNTSTEIKISGQIFDSSGAAVEGVTVVCSYNSSTRTTDTSGYYSFRVPSGWSGTVTPQSTTYTFTPAKYTYESVKADTSDQNFTAATSSGGETTKVPVAKADSIYTTENTAVGITLSGTASSTAATLVYTIVSQPMKGTLTGTAPNMTYTPTTDYVGVDSFTFKVNDGSQDSVVATISITVQSSELPDDTGDWVAPIGIPTPSFGLEETHWMYKTATYDYGNGAEAYHISSDGPYTYYVDNTSSAATDTNNTYGSPSKPRKTIPMSYLPAGSVVEIHGGPYTQSSGGVLPFCGSGTAAKPVFFRGPSNGTHPTISTSFRVRGSYVILENLKMVTGAFSDSTGITINNAAIRHCEVSGNQGIGLNVASYTSDIINNIVIYDNVIHDLGNINSTTDEDATGIAVNAGVSNCWIVDNTVYNTSGSGIQIVAGSLAKMPTTNHIYVGRNLVYRARQSGIWSKQSADCVFSQNTVHSIINTSWSPSKGLGYQYGPERLWIIYNEVYDCTFGITAMSTSGLGSGTEAYVIGNVIHDIHHLNDGTSFFNPNTSWSNAGIMLVGVAKNYVVNNSIYDADAGINIPSTGAVYMENNIISNITESACQHIFVETSSAMSASTVNNNIFYQNGSDIRIRWGLSHTYTLPAFQSATGKGANCVNANPLFVDAANGDLHVKSGSPAINAGLTSEVYTRFYNLYGRNIAVDPDKVSRPQGSKWDIGAYEYK
jgi:hypothetical protein